MFPDRDGGRTVGVGESGSHHWDQLMKLRITPRWFVTKYSDAVHLSSPFLGKN